MPYRCDRSTFKPGTRPVKRWPIIRIGMCMTSSSSSLSKERGNLVRRVNTPRGDLRTGMFACSVVPVNGYLKNADMMSRAADKQTRNSLIASWAGSADNQRGGPLRRILQKLPMTAANFS
jgi:hypothetical protein